MNNVALTLYKCIEKRRISERMFGCLRSLFGDLFQFVVEDGYVAYPYILGTFEVVKASCPIDNDAGPEDLRVRDQLLPGVVLELGVVSE